MIPKIIHFCWLNEGPLPKSVEKYIQTWRDKMPDYEVKRWDFNRFPRSKSDWVAEAFDARKYAFAADYIRNYALYTEGGIYLDSDVEALQSFDDLLHLPYFLGFENGSGNIEAAVMGAEPGLPMFGQMLQYYQGRHFVDADGNMDTLPLPYVMGKVLGPKYRILPIDNPAEFDRSPDVLSVLPYDFFSPVHIEHKRLMQTSRTRTIHHFAASWTTGWPKYRRILKRIVGPSFTQWWISSKKKVISFFR